MKQMEALQKEKREIEAAQKKSLRDSAKGQLCPSDSSGVAWALQKRLKNEEAKAS